MNCPWWKITVKVLLCSTHLKLIWVWNNMRVRKIITEFPFFVCVWILPLKRSFFQEKTRSLPCELYLISESSDCLVCLHAIRGRQETFGAHQFSCSFHERFSIGKGGYWHEGLKRLSAVECQDLEPTQILWKSCYCECFHKHSSAQEHYLYSNRHMIW